MLLKAAVAVLAECEGDLLIQEDFEEVRWDPAGAWHVYSGQAFINAWLRAGLHELHSLALAGVTLPLDSCSGLTVLHPSFPPRF